MTVNETGSVLDPKSLHRYSLLKAITSSKKFLNVNKGGRQCSVKWIYSLSLTNMADSEGA